MLRRIIAPGAAMTESRLQTLRRMAPLFLRFGSVGLAGFIVDTAVVYGTKRWLGLYGAGALSYIVAASCNWMLNRHWTFAHRPRKPMAQQWLLFLTTSLPGLVFNRGAYALLIATVPLCARHPILAIVAGSAAGMTANFIMAHRVVFAEPAAPTSPL
jgi:putative flippase GtrA